MTATGTTTRARLVEHVHGHVPEVIGVLLAGIVISGSHLTSLPTGETRWWLSALLGLAMVVSAWTYTRWGPAARGWPLHLRIATQIAALATIAAISGIGAALLGPLSLLSIAHTIRYSGAVGGGPAIGWALTGIGAHQLVVTAFQLPTGVAREVGHGLAALGAVIVVMVGHRLFRLAAGGEAAVADVVTTEHRIHAMLTGSTDVTLIIGDDVITYQSPSVPHLLGYDEDVLVDRHYLDLVHPEDRDRVDVFVHGLLETPNAPGFLTCRMQLADGTYHPVEWACRNLTHDQAVAGVVVHARDVSEREELQRELTHRAFHDDLTGLPNRALLVDRLRHAIRRAGRFGYRYAVLYIDLDGFKPINDTFGHDAGDVVLTTIAHRLIAVTRGTDTVARLGGDEFAVLVEEHTSDVDAARIANRIADEVRRPILAGGSEVQVTASIGIAFDLDGQEPTEVLRNADIAMYLAKRDGKNCFEVFEPRMHVAVVERLQLEQELQRALDHDEIVVHYQPIVSLADRSIVGVEALARWVHTERGTIPPATFIPLAEETGLIVAVGRRVLHDACAQVMTWRRTVPGAHDLTLSVNVSMRQFALGDLLDDVSSALETTGLPASALTLELTESSLVRDVDHTLYVLERLKSLGVHLAIDDFGTGYSALAYLHRFPVDVLKIDREFVTSVVSGQRSPALARAIVELGRSLDLVTVAEGIEHDDELAQFRELECALGQGYLFARPAGADDITRKLHASFAPHLAVVTS